MRLMGRASLHSIRHNASVLDMEQRRREGAKGGHNVVELASWRPSPSSQTWGAAPGAWPGASSETGHGAGVSPRAGRSGCSPMGPARSPRAGTGCDRGRAHVGSPCRRRSRVSPSGSATSGRR